MKTCSANLAIQDGVQYGHQLLQMKAKSLSQYQNVFTMTTPNYVRGTCTLGIHSTYDGKRRCMLCYTHGPNQFRVQNLSAYASI